jgi:hypothetical protein
MNLLRYDKKLVVNSLVFVFYVSHVDCTSINSILVMADFAATLRTLFEQK